MAKNPWTPDEPEEILELERNFLAGDLICGVGYGIQIVLYTSCVLYLWKHRRENRNSLFLLAYITLLLTIETMFVIVQGKTVQEIYIDNRNYPAGPWQYFLNTQNLAYNVMFYATLFVLTFLSDLLILWRCWVIWLPSGRLLASVVVFFPGLMTLASFVMGTLWTLQSSKPGLSLYSKLPMAYGTSYYTISLSINIVLTILITLRLIMHRRNILKQLPPDYASHYVSLATIVVESAALYSLFGILFLITYAVNNPTNQVFLGMASAAQQIAAYLIIYRVAEGKAWSSSTLAEQPLTTIVEINTRGTTTSGIDIPSTPASFAADTKQDISAEGGRRRPAHSTSSQSGSPV